MANISMWVPASKRINISAITEDVLCIEATVTIEQLDAMIKNLQMQKLIAVRLMILPSNP